MQPAKAELATLAVLSYAAQGLSMLLSMGGSGENPVSTMVSQNRKMLQEIQDRLDGYDQAFGEILSKLDELPKQFRQDLSAQLTAEAARDVSAALMNIDSDLAVLARLKDPGAWTGSTQSRLDHLQEAGARLIQHEEDAAVLIPAVAAFEFEKLMLLIQPGTEEERRINVYGRAKLYGKRFERMLSDSRSGSLRYRVDERARDFFAASRKVQKIHRAMSTKPLYVKNSKHLGGGPGRYKICGPERLYDHLSPHVSEAWERIEQVHRELHRCPKNGKFEACPSDKSEVAEELLFRVLLYLEDLAEHQVFTLREWELEPEKPSYYEATLFQAFMKVGREFYEVEPVLLRTGSEEEFTWAKRERVREIETGQWAQVKVRDIPAPKMLAKVNVYELYHQKRGEALEHIRNVVAGRPSREILVCTY